MKGFLPNTYGDRYAEVYDAWGIGPETEETVQFLFKVCEQGPALELGIGTGRVALPLSELGTEIHGIEASEAMVAKLRDKPGGKDIPVTIEDFRELRVSGSYPVIFCVFNSIACLLTQEDQVECFRSVASHLTEDGIFVVEAAVPHPGRYEWDQRTRTVEIGLDFVRLAVERFNPVTQVVDQQDILIEDGRTRFYPVSLRYVWPSELDLMAKLAGLRLRRRIADWYEQPFSADSVRHISIYEPDPDATL